MEFNFAGKKALITGGGSGLGRECALLFAKGGADVLIADLKPERCEAVANEVRALGRNAIAYALDVTDYAQVEAMYKRIVEEWGTVDFVVNSAGVCLTEDLTVQSVIIPYKIHTKKKTAGIILKITFCMLLNTVQALCWLAKHPAIEAASLPAFPSPMKNN